MTTPSETITFYDVRHSCGLCGRFIAESAIRERDFRDDSYYYGIRTETEYDCTGCGTVRDEPSITQTRALTLAEHINGRTS